MTGGRWPLWMSGFGAATLVLLGGADAACAQATARTSTTPAVATTAEGALAMAEAAFEYRDFEAVVLALDPWVHPPRIEDRAAMIRARRLLGVALHIQSDERAAREEFAQLLLLDPGHRLDPFVIPPRVIATFEDVRRQLAPRLERPPPEPRTNPATPVDPPSSAVAFAPLGINHVLLDEPELGVLFGVLQVAGLALNVAAYWAASETVRGSSERQGWLIAQGGGLALFGLSYGVSAAWGFVQLDGRVDGALEGPEGPPPPTGARLRFRF